MRQSASLCTFGSSAHRYPHGPRRMNAVRSPAALAGSRSLSRWSPDVDNLVWLARRNVDDVCEKCRVRLGDTPLGGRGHQVGGQVQVPQDLAGPCRPIAGDADPQPHLAQPRQRQADVGIEVFLAVLLTGTGVLAALPFGGQVEARPEVLKGLGVVAAFRGDRSQDCGESVAGHAEPLRAARATTVGALSDAAPPPKRNRRLIAASAALPVPLCSAFASLPGAPAGCS